MIYKNYIKINDQEIPLKILLDKRMKRMKISVLPDECVLKIHPAVRTKQRLNFLKNNKNWIFEKYNEVNASIKKIQPEFINGDEIPFLGSFLKLRLSKLHSECTMNNSNELIMPDSENKIELLTKFYLNQSQILLQKYNRQYFTINRKISKIRLRALSSRWGSCSETGAITINWRLIIAPENIFEYVYIHEICHLKNKTHSHSFWTLVKEHIPDFPSRRHWLNKNTFFLMNYPEPVSCSKHGLNITFK